MSVPAASASAPVPARKGLHIGLWVVQVLLALAFGMAGVMKMTTPIADLAAQMAWTGELPGLVRFIGVSEFLGAIGLILPSALRIQPKLTGFAAIGLVVVMILAAAFHTSRGEPGLPVNLVLGAMAAFVAWGRLRAAPIASRG